LNSSALPSLTGNPASGPMSPSPSTRLPSETTATRLARLVCSNDSSGSRSITLHDAATPGVYQTEKSANERIAHLGSVCILPR